MKDFPDKLNENRQNTMNHKQTPSNIKIQATPMIHPFPLTGVIESSMEDEKQKKINEKEKHRERQRQRRQKMTGTMDLLKSLVPECVKREAEAATGKKKMKVDQTQLLEMTVDYIKQLTDTISQLKHENTTLKSYISHHNLSESESCSDNSLSSNSSPESSPNAHIHCNEEEKIELEEDRNSYIDREDDNEISQSNLLSKRNFSTFCNGEEPIRKAKQPRLVRSARILMVMLFAFALFYYTPITDTNSLSISLTPSPAFGRVILSTTETVTQSVVFSFNEIKNWFGVILSIFISKIMIFITWTFCAMLLDYIYVPSDNVVNLAKRENDIGVKKYDRGDYHSSRRHFEKALRLLGRSPTPSVFYCIYHVPLEIWRQVWHLLRIGLWCDGHLVHIRGSQNYMLEMARCNHYLFSLHMLANNLNSHSILHLIVSLNTAESLYQKPPLLAEVYATIAVAFYGLLKMPKAYQYLMGKAWNIVDNFKEKSDEEASSEAYLLFLSSYGSLCAGDLRKVQNQIQKGCDLFLKKGNKNMFFQGQFFISYTHFLRGNYFTTMKIMNSIEVCNLGDPRISWWQAVLIYGCKVSYYLLLFN